MSARFKRHTGEPSSRLLDATEARMVEHVALIHPTIALGADAIVRRVLGKQSQLTIDPLADRCMTEVAALLESKPARPFSAYVALEVAAAREPGLFGPSYRTYRDRMMRTLLGLAREAGVMVSVADTTVVGRWVGRDAPKVRATLVDGSLHVTFGPGVSIVLDPELGMVEGCDG
jgi:hypothetical protein